MEEKMNNEKFTKFLVEKTGKSLEECNQIFEVIKNMSVIGRKNKDKMIQELMVKLKINEREANEMYNITSEFTLKNIFNK